MAFHHVATGKRRTVKDVAKLSAVNVVSLNNINNVKGEVKQKKIMSLTMILNHRKKMMIWT